MSMLTIRNKKCCRCGKRIIGGYSHTIYCPTCSAFAIRMIAKKFTPEIVKSLWEYVAKYGYVCYYTRMLLDMTDIHSPWYCVFDHWNPRDPGRVVITSSLLNEMKANLTEDEFWHIIHQLANHKRHGTKFRKITLKYWEPRLSVDDVASFGSAVSLVSQTLARVHPCAICGKRVFIYNAKYCPRCAKFALRLHSKQLPPETIEDTLNYVHKNGFTCFYTEIALDLDDPKSPWYCVLDHWIPHNPGKIVLTCALFNVMKSDLSEEEFWYYVKAFADYKENGKKVRKRKLAYFWRLCPPEDG